MENISHMPVPIAELGPTLQELNSKSIKAVVTLTWPYSSATGSVAFLLAEPDFRLRRTRGQVRVQFAGSSAKHVAKSRIASGDEVILCLDGVEWIHDAANVSTPGRGIEYELKFTERLLLRFQTEGSETVESIDIDHPAPEPQTEREPSPEVVSVDITPSRTPPPILKTNGASTQADPASSYDSIFSSPAFVKRARTSYGSLFEVDPFAEEDGTVPGKGRKRTRLSSAWTYTSRSPTPEPEKTEEEEDFSMAESTKPIMTDEGCQTIGLEDGSAVGTLASFSRQAINVGGAPYTKAITPNPEAGSPTPIITYTQPSTALEYISEAEKIDEINGDQEARVSPQPQIQPFQALPISKGYVGGIEQIEPTQFAGSYERHQLEGGDEVDGFVPLDGHTDLYAASPRDPGDERELSGFGDLHVPPADTNGIDTSMSVPIDQAIPETIYEELQDTTAHLRHFASTEDMDEHPNEMREDNKFYIEEADGSSPPPHPHPLDSATQLYPNIDDLAEQTLIPTWGAPPASISYPNLESAHDRMEARSETVQAPNSAAMSRSQSAQSQVVDLTESSDEEEEEEEDEDQSEEGEYSGESEKYAQIQSQIGSQGSLVDEDEASVTDEEEHDANAVHNGYLQQASGMAEENAHGSQMDQDGYYEDEYDEDEDEELYDEEMEDYETPPEASAPKDPVVIDLLSSDDEAAEEPFESKPPLALSLPSQPAHDSDQSEESEESQDDASSSDEEAREEPARSKLGIASAEEHPSQDQATDEAKGETSDEEMQEDEYISSPDPLQADFPLDESPTKPAESEQQPLDQAFEGEEADADVNIENPKNTHTVIDMASSIPEHEQVDEDHAIQAQLSYDLAEDVAENKNSEEEHLGLESPKVAYAMETKGFNEENTEVGSMSLRKRSRSPTTLGLDGANGDRNASPTLFRNGPSSLPLGSPLKALPLPYSESLNEGGSIQLPTPDSTQLSAPIVSADTSFSTGLDSQTSVIATQNTLITQASILAEEPAPDAESGETKAEAVELSRYADVDQHGQPSISDVATTPTPIKELIREESPETNEEQVTVEEATEEPAGAKTNNEAGGDFISGEATQKVNRRTRSSKKTDDVPLPENKSPTITHLRRSHRRIKSTSSSTDPGKDEHQPELQEPAVVTPRRSHRRIKSTTPNVDATVIRPETPNKSGEKNGTQADDPLQMAVDEPSTPKGHDASFELALSSLDSPSKGHNLRTPPADLKLRLSRALRTELGEFTALKVLRYHLNHKIDVLAIVTTTPPEPQRSKGGPRHYQITFNVTDPTIAPNSVAEIQIFRPYKEALPVVQTGDGILLRNFQVVAVKNRGFGLRSEQNEASSWAVFKDGEEAEVRGPPVEYGAAEKNHIASLKTWYGTLDTVAMAKLNRANADKGTSSGKATRKTT